MSSTNGNADRDERDVPTESVEATARDAAARCLARALVCAFDACDESGIPLSQLQRVAILEAVLCEFDGLREHLSSLATVSRILGEFGLPASGPLYLA